MTNKLRILIAEDDAIISETLKNYLEDFGNTVTGIVSNIKEATPCLNEQPDFVFLDIRMHGIDEGFNIAKVIQENYFIPFIFLTSFSDKKTIQQAAKYRPSTYLIKPFTKNDIYAALEIALAKVDIENEDKIHLVDGQKNYYVNPKEVIFLESEDKYVKIQMRNKRILLRIPLKEIINLFPSNFIQCHRSYIINKHFVSKLSSQLVELGEFEIPVSKSFKLNL